MLPGRRTKVIPPPPSPRLVSGLPAVSVPGPPVHTTLEAPLFVTSVEDGRTYILISASRTRRILNHLTIPLPPLRTGYTTLQTPLHTVLTLTPSVADALSVVVSPQTLAGV